MSVTVPRRRPHTPEPRPTTPVVAHDPIIGRPHCHTSMRLDADDRRRLRELARRRNGRDGGVRTPDGIKHTMTSVMRSLIREAAKKEGIE